MKYVNVQGTKVSMPDDEPIFDIDVQQPVMDNGYKAKKWPKAEYEPNKFRNVLKLALTRVSCPWWMRT